MSDPRFDNNMRGVLFKNNKDGVETRADYRGEAEINKVEFYINAWINQDKSGRKFMTLKFRPKSQHDVKDAPRSPPPIGRPEPRVRDPFNDDISDIPF